MQRAETKEDVEKAMKLFLFAAEAGNVESQYALSEIFLAGRYIEQDVDQALKWLFKAANQGCARAQHELGVCYSKEGMGLVVDDVQSVFWHRKAAEQNYAASQYALGLKYFYGFGTGKDIAQALDWIRQAAINENVTAKDFLESFMLKVAVPTKNEYVLYNNPGKLSALSSSNTMILIQNNGEKLLETNYFDSPQASIGEYYLSWNAGVARLLVPDLSAHALTEMRTGKKAYIIEYSDAIEIVFDDYTQSPFFIVINKRQCDRALGKSKNSELVVYSRQGKEFKIRAKAQLSSRRYQEGLPFKSH